MLATYLRKVRFFQEFITTEREHIVLQLCKKLFLTKYKRGDILFKRGDPSSLFYIVVKGAVNVYISQPMHTQGKARHSEERTMNTNGEDARVHALAYCSKYFERLGGMDMSRYIDDPFFFDQHNYSIKVTLGGTSRVGDSFGEVGIMKGIPRTATLICRDDETYLATLDSDSFKRILYPEESMAQEKKLKFFREAVFGKADLTSNGRVLDSFTQRTFLKGDKLYQEGAEVKSAYIIVKGRLRLHRWATRGLKETGKVVENVAVAEVGECTLLVDWTTSYPPTHIDTAVVISDQILVYECPLDSYIEISKQYPQIFADLKDKLEEKHSMRSHYIEKYFDAKTGQDRKGRPVLPLRIVPRKVIKFNMENSLGSIGDSPQLMANQLESIERTLSLKSNILKKQLSLERIASPNTSNRQDIDVIIRRQFAIDRPAGVLKRKLTNKLEAIVTKPEIHTGYTKFFKAIRIAQKSTNQSQTSPFSRHRSEDVLPSTQPSLLLTQVSGLSRYTPRSPPPVLSCRPFLNNRQHGQILEIVKRQKENK